MIYGWGSGSKNFSVPGSNTQAILTEFSYIHLCFLLRITFNRRWFLLENVQANELGAISTTHRAISQEEVKNILGQNPVRPFWWLFNQSLLIFGLVALIVMFFSNFSVTGNILEQPSENQILQIQTWNAEQNQIIEKGSLAEFESFLDKFRGSEEKQKAAILKRMMLGYADFEADYQRFLMLLPAEAKADVSKYDFYCVAKGVVETDFQSEQDPNLFIAQTELYPDDILKTTEVQFTVRVKEIPQIPGINSESIRYFPITKIHTDLV